MPVSIVIVQHDESLGARVVVSLNDAIREAVPPAAPYRNIDEIQRADSSYF